MDCEDAQIKFTVPSKRDLAGEQIDGPSNGIDRAVALPRWMATVANQFRAVKMGARCDGYMQHAKNQGLTTVSFRQRFV